MHCHSCFSDGTFSPEELVDLAVSKNLKAIALTDHNTTEGLERFYKAAKGKIEACGGCEITTEINGQELHLLALFLDSNKIKPLTDALKTQLECKEKSNKQTIENIAKDGYDVSYEEFIKNFGKGSKNRVHIAKYLVQKRIFSNIDDAFKDMLSPKGKYYKDAKKLNFYEMIKLINDVGGISVWAHPLYHVNKETCEQIIREAKKVGLSGVEVYYNSFSEDEVAFMEKICEKYNLIASGGSDFHGENTPDRHLGIGSGDSYIPFSCYENLKNLK